MPLHPYQSHVTQFYNILLMGLWCTVIQQVMSLRVSSAAWVVQWLICISQQSSSAVASIHHSRSARCLQSAVSFFRVVSMRGRNVQISSLAPQHIRQDYPQAARRLSRLFVRFSCHSSSGWQRHCTSDPSSFSRLFSSITSDQTTRQTERNSALFSNIKWIQRRIWEILDHFLYLKRSF